VGSGGIIPPFLTPALGGGKWSASRPPTLNPGERISRYILNRWLGGFLDAMRKRKISCFCRYWNPGKPARSQSLFRLSYPGSCMIDVTWYIALVVTYNFYLKNFSMWLTCNETEQFCWIRCAAVKFYIYARNTRATKYEKWLRTHFENLHSPFRPCVDNPVVLCPLMVDICTVKCRLSHGTMRCEPSLCQCWFASDVHVYKVYISRIIRSAC
jgi:hypothetical protein